MGVETEYAVIGMSSRGERIDPDALTERLIDQAVASLPHLPARSEPGIFLPNGGRLYVDTGSHIEFSTPECGSPDDIVRAIEAGDRILLALADGLVARAPDIADVAVYRHNVDYLSRTSWGCHESYLHTVEPDTLHEQLAPLLASRVIFGAGGFDARSPGIRFVLSPRAAFIDQHVTLSSLYGRGLFHVKDDPLAGHGYRRLHLICGESLTSQLGTYLKVGSTALAVALVEDGHRLADEVGLRDPVAALSLYSGDPSLRARAPSRDGGLLRALDVQRHYLGRAEAAARRSFAPRWAVPFCSTWRATLHALERDPHALDRPLDWPVRRALFAAQAARAGLDWPTLRAWNRLAVARAGGETDLADGLADAWRRFERLRSTLFALDVRFARIGPNGLAARLESTGAFSHRALPAPSLDDALWSAPPGRSRLRGRAIARLVDRRGGAACDWTSVVDGDGRLLDLTDPLVRRTRWTRATREASGDSGLPDGIRLRRVLKAHGDRVTWVTWARDGRLLSAAADGTARVWTTLAGHVLDIMEPHGEPVIGAAWGNDGRVVTLSRDGMLRIWAPGLAPPGSDAGPLASAASTGTGPSWSSAPGAPLVSGAEGARVSLWDPDLTAQAQLEGHTGEIRSVAVSADGTLIASGADHGELILWDARRRTLLARLEGHQGAVRSVAFSADGQQLASAGDDSTVRVWDVPAGSRLAVLRGHRRGVSEVAFAADGALLASRGEDQLIRLWRVDAWREVALLPDRVPERRPRGLAFHPYRPWLAVPDAAVIRIWELEPEVLLAAR